MARTVQVRRTLKWLGLSFYLLLPLVSENRLRDSAFFQVSQRFPQFLFTVDGPAIQPSCQAAETRFVRVLDLRVNGEQPPMVLQTQAS